MEISELTAYASEKYQIQEQFKWADFPGFSVLAHPQSGKWIALLMRQWDSETGEEIQKCDLKCGEGVLERYPRPYLSRPVRMHGNNWMNISFDRRTEKDTVFHLFDLAVAFGSRSGYTITLDSGRQDDRSAYQDTKISFGRKFSGQSPERGTEQESARFPERLREMRSLYAYGLETAESRAKHFYRQAQFMQDYEDDYPWKGPFDRYFPTYQDLTTRQLRGYFSWRTNVRRGKFEAIPVSAAYIYIYELLNGIGASGPEDVLEKLARFRTGFLDAGYGDAVMRTNLQRWMFEYAVIHALPSGQAAALAPDLQEQDEALSVLCFPEEYPDDEVFEALCRFGRKTMKSSPSYTVSDGKGKHLLCEAWRAACADAGQDNLFARCFGKRSMRPWHPLSNAVCYVRGERKDRDFVLDKCRSYHCRNGVWQVNTYEPLLFDRGRMYAFLRTADLKLRRYLKTGHYLREKPEETWADCWIEQAIGADIRAMAEAAKPRIEIDLSALDQIRQDALLTRESLLTDEERGIYPGVSEPADGIGSTADVQNAETKESGNSSPETVQDVEIKVSASETKGHAVQAEGTQAEGTQTEGTQAALKIPLNPVEIRILQALLEGRDPSDIIRENHGMPSILADAVNEALFDEFGDTIVLCEEDRLFLAEDYIEELKEYLGGKTNG